MKLLKSVLSIIPGRGAKLLPALGAWIFALGALSCETIYDDQDDCLRGISLRFVYDYHMMRGANAFPEYVDCITVYVFDKEGNFVTQQSETTDVLRDENYRMILQLEPGDYDLVAYGGITCPANRFDLTPDFADNQEANRTDLTVTLPVSNQPLNASDVQLHDIENRKGGLFYGTLAVTMPSEYHKGGYMEETVSMMNDTNNIQVILQELNRPYQVNYEDYTFRILDDNFVLDYNNDVVETPDGVSVPHYRPYHAENRISGYYEPVLTPGVQLEPDEEQLVQVACAEFSTSRLVMKHYTTSRLVITHNASGRDVVSLPLIEYLTMIRGWGDSWIKSDQEFLDRQHRWTLMFFLQEGYWWNAIISINAWTVRVNNIDDLN